MARKEQNCDIFHLGPILHELLNDLGVTVGAREVECGLAFVVLGSEIPESWGGFSVSLSSTYDFEEIIFSSSENQWID